MAQRLRRLLTAAAASVLASSLLAACASGPVSQATFLATTAAPSGETGSAAASAGGESPSASSPAPSEAASVAVTIDVPPPKPGNPTFKHVGETPGPAPGTFIEQYRITWTSPKGAASSFLVYGLTVCLRDSVKYDGKACVVRGMKIPVKQLDLLGEVSGDARSIMVSWQLGEAGPGPYWAILMRATNPFGDSIFTIVHSDKVCFGCTY